MSIPDRIHSASIREALATARYEAGLRAKTLRLLDRLGRDLASDLTGAGLDTPRTDWQRARLRELLKATTKRVQEAYGEIGALSQDELKGLVQVSSDRIVVAMNKAIGADLLQPINWSDEQLKAIVGDTLIEGAPSADWWSRQSTGLSQAFSDQMRLGMIRGESLGNMVKRVRALDGIAHKNAEKLVRTSVISVNSAAHMAAYEANSDIIAGVEWLSALDSRTCPSCGELDGKIWKLGVSHPVPSLHWNCRCTVLPKTKSWEELLGNKALGRELDKIPQGDRASINGPVSGDTNFESWLKNQDEETQIEVLGKAKRAIWAKSGMHLSDLVDGRGRELTLEQLRNL